MTGLHDSPWYRVAPWTVRQAIVFVRRVHRRLPKIQGGLWAVRLVGLDALAGTAEEQTIGCAVVAHPARLLMQAADVTLTVARVAVLPGHPNACSRLYGACARAARAMGAANLNTYTHLDEDAASVRASGWIDGGLTDGGEWDRDERQRSLAVDPSPKRRWWAPWSVRARLKEAS